MKIDSHRFSVHVHACILARFVSQKLLLIFQTRMLQDWPELRTMQTMSDIVLRQYSMQRHTSSTRLPRLDFLDFGTLFLLLILLESSISSNLTLIKRTCLDKFISCTFDPSNRAHSLCLSLWYSFSNIIAANYVC